MAIKLGNNPKDFKRAVPIIRLDGTNDSITITFKYRTRREFAALLDERMAAAKMAQDQAAAKLAEALDTAGEAEATMEQIKFEKSYLEMTKLAAEQVLQVASGWDLVDAFTVENLQQLEDEFPGALDSIHGIYQKAVAEVRVKN